ncbi:unnamed protein product [Caenorhabditis brenneri]
MHLLAIVDTLSHFASDAKDKVEEPNAAMKQVVQSYLSDNAAGGYVTAAAGTGSVDECGLRYIYRMHYQQCKRQVLASSFSLYVPPKGDSLGRGLSPLWKIHSAGKRNDAALKKN